MLKHTALLQQSRYNIQYVKDTTAGTPCFKTDFLSYIDEGNKYADKLLCSNCLRIAIIFTLNSLTHNRVGPVVHGRAKYRSKWTGNKIICVPYTCCFKKY